MTYQTERDQFIDRMAREGLAFDVTLALLREATGLNRRAELACSSVAADRDRVKCPVSTNPQAPCLCDGGGHDGSDQAITRISLQDWYAERRIAKRMPAGWTYTTQGDPRGYVLRVIPPSYAERNAGRDQFNQDAIGVPNRPSGLRF